MLFYSGLKKTRIIYSADLVQIYSRLKNKINTHDFLQWAKKNKINAHNFLQWAKNNNINAHRYFFSLDINYNGYPGQD